ncbi:GHKL domain-containing protein [Microcella flavibacter]|uniref:GHKL domain-containing protein n=1 Tax=Microcella flavibacter TaxID=1804990 RepID=UPI001E3C7263|nr:GHKL domain-containing protein [Microcella flavibacter]
MLMRSLQNEPVNQIRQIFNDVLAARQASPPETETKAPSVMGTPHVDAPELARLIRHELSPPIGWIRRAGNKEIEEFPKSGTNDAVNRLERRVDAIVALIKADSPLELVSVDLEDVLRGTWPDFATTPSFSPAQELIGRRPNIQTDLGLFELILSNVYQNAVDASNELEDPPPVSVAWSEVDGRFWVRVSNAFRGSQFDVQDVEAAGISTKAGHQGIGISLVQSASARLAYGFRVTGQSGVATFTLTGEVAVNA